jgi:mannose/cellobiose epimerase-like protein (N-acyl-D-glucosamine 2-epimerase family)
MSTEHASRGIDLEWFRTHCTDEILPRWLAAAVSDDGFFLPHLDRRWRPAGPSFATIVSQSRLLYNFSCGYRLTNERGYLHAVETGLMFLLRHFRDRDCGGWYWSCDRSGTPLDTRKECYGHAFALFGLSHAYAVTRAPEATEAIRHTWDVLRTHFREAGGGYAQTLDRRFGAPRPQRSQNPLMHLFEALVAASTFGEQPSLGSEAVTVAEFVQGLLDADGRLPEVYDDSWTALGEQDGGRLDIGHAFEWAFLLSHAVSLGMPGQWVRTARAFLNYGIALGYDAAQGGIFSPASPDGALRQRGKGWWEQCEAIRALLHFRYRRASAQVAPLLQASIDYVQRAFIDPEYGGWYAAPNPRPDSRQAHKGSEWKLDYHVVAMCMEAMAIQESAA